MRYLLLAIVCIFHTQNYSQDKSLNQFHPFSDAVVFTGEFGGTFPYTDYSFSDLDLSGRASVEYYFPSNSIHAIGIKFLGGGGFLSGEGEINYRKGNYRTGYFFFGGGITYAINTPNGVPYLSANVAYLHFDPRNKNGYALPNIKQMEYKPNAIIYDGELGMRFPFSNILSLNVGINYNFTNTDYLDDTNEKSNNDNFITALVGLSIYFGGDKDEDEDGIEDNIDICPETPTGVLVDNFGCPLDSDADGVPDYLDKCPDTQQDIMVDENGCSKEQQLKHSYGKIIGKDSISTKKDSLETAQGYLNYDQKNEVAVDEIYYSDGKIYCFQIGLFQNRDAAVKETNALRQKGHSVFISKVVPFNDSNVWYSVRIGYFNSLADASKYKEKYFK